MCVLMFLGIFPITCVKKNVYMYFWVIFQQLKKKFAQKVQQKRIWATAQLYCEKKNLYCNLAIVLQERGLEKKIVLELYCKRRV